MNPDRKINVTRRVLGVLFTAAGIAHFTKANFFAGLVPERLADYRREINLGTGVLQTAGGLTFFFPRLRNLARWSTIALLVPTFPEAVNQVRQPERLKALGVPPRLAIPRILAQILVLAVTWWATRDTDRLQNNVHSDA